MSTPLGRKLNTLRKNAGLTLEALAKEIGSSKSYIWALENKDKASPSTEILQKIARVLCVTVEYFLDTEDISEITASDVAFFKKYQKMDSRKKEKFRAIVNMLTDS